MTARRRLQSSDLFGDEALIRLIARHPWEMIDFLAPGDAPGAQESLARGEMEGMSAAALLSAAHRGRLSIHLRRAMNIHPDYRALARGAFAALRPIDPRFHPARVSGDIYITSPAGHAPFADDDDVMLWRVRGARRVQETPHLHSDRAAGARSAYAAGFDRDLRAFGLMPGALGGPQRVGGLNVCVVTEWANWRVSLSDGVRVANSALRRRFAQSAPAN